jgi:hypothetical protein
MVQREDKKAKNILPVLMGNYHLLVI